MLGYRELWLSTRRVNLRAVRFYAGRGYAAVEHYGQYVGRDESVCLGKRLVQPSPLAGTARPDTTGQRRAKP